MKKISIKDSKNREIIRINSKGQIAAARYPDLDEKLKKYVSILYTKLTGEKGKKIVDFLNYKTNENEFCS